MITKNTNYGLWNMQLTPSLYNLGIILLEPRFRKNSLQKLHDILVGNTYAKNTRHRSQPNNVKYICLIYFDGLSRNVAAILKRDMEEKNDLLFVF